MKTLELKTELHSLIEDITDTQLLMAIKILLTKGKNNDWWKTLSEEEKIIIEKGLKESEEGNLIPHNMVMEETKEKQLKY
ncbi:hypothetical protein D1164_21815 [Mariniphaga sediminis]|uniref:Uncharacterized protein n=1 Tax=Mariniphaga sediminis TaxID=1628158 RepID=A0A399CTG6_9BACT|nr:hypothetical protein [Mariniphaga sediminis]RIH63069.1 hypothetical protein D1164_21815 [Mariniphaga sediminis]